LPSRRTERANEKMQKTGRTEYHMSSSRLSISRSTSEGILVWLYARRSRLEDALLMHHVPCRYRAPTLADQHGKLSSAWTKRGGFPRRREINDWPCGLFVHVTYQMASQHTLFHSVICRLRVACTRLATGLAVEAATAVNARHADRCSRRSVTL
jgi:hypothetical protein